jgi:hypothetical protein
MSNMLRRKEMRKASTIFIFNLALSDFLLASSIPFTVFDALTRAWLLPYSWCRWQGIGSFTPVSSFTGTKERYHNLLRFLRGLLNATSHKNIPLHCCLHVLPDYRGRGRGQVQDHRAVTQDTGQKSLFFAFKRGCTP